MKKTLKTLVAGVTAATIALVGGVVLAPSAALAADTTGAPGPAWAYTAPWAAGDSVISHPAWTDETVARGPSGSVPIDFDSATTGGPATVTYDAGVGMACKPGIGCNSTDFYAPGGGRAWYSGSTSVLLLEPQESVAVDLVERFSALNLTGEFYIPTADASTGAKAFTGTADGATQMYGDRPFTVRPDGNGVRFTFDMGAQWAKSEGFGTRVVARTTSGTQVNLYVTVSTLNWGGAPSPSADGLAYTAKVGESVAIPDGALHDAVRWSSGVQARVVVDGLPASVTAVPGGYVYAPTAVETTGFGFRGEEVQAPAGYITGTPGRVSLTALPADVTGPTDPEPAVTAPAVDDFAFPAPLPGGVAAEVNLLALTHGDGFDPREWVVEASDAVRWDVRGTTLLLTPEQDGVALSTTWRWRSVIDPSVASAWATVTAPAATPVTPEPEPTPTVTPTPTPSVTPTPPPGGAKTGDEGLTLLGYGAALLLGAAVAFLTRSRRFARR